MNINADAMSTDEYFVTAQHIFEDCGVVNTSKLRVNTLMDKFAPVVKTNRAEYSHLCSILDPDEENPEISVTELAHALNKFSETQKSKVDLDESFNLKNGAVLQDSDSGISSDGYQLLEELQCELREKTHLAHQLRSQLDYSDRQHEETVATLTAERDSLRTRLNMVREENVTLGHVRHDYGEVCDRLCSAELALEETRRQLENASKRANVLREQVASLEANKLILDELLCKSKAECHRINEMYASRQSALLEENETLKTEHADLTARLQDQDEFMQQVIKEKVLLEMELKDILNKSNQTHLRLDKSIDVSYTEDQMLTALDSLNADSRFSTENQLLDEESFTKALKEDQGRATNMSLFDEIRLSFNLSRNTDLTQCIKCLHDTSFSNIGIQTDAEKPNDNNNNICENNTKDIGSQTCIDVKEKILQTDIEMNANSKVECIDCELVKNFNRKLEDEVKDSKNLIKDMELEVLRYEQNLDVLEKFVKDGSRRNEVLEDVVKRLQSKIDFLEDACANQHELLVLSRDSVCVQCQTDSDQVSVCTQADVPCVDCSKRSAVVPNRSIRRYLWEPLKCLFQLFAVVCFVLAVSVLYGVSRRWTAKCEREVMPWKWLDAQDIMDLFLRIEYVADVPM